MDNIITFPPVDLNRVLQSHEDALILKLGIGDFDVRGILVDPGSSANLLQILAYRQIGLLPSVLENPRQILSGFNGVSTTSLGDVVLPIQAGPVTQNVQFSVVKDRSTFNVIMGCTWLHNMKVIPSTYHQMVRYLTEDKQIDLLGSQLATRQCYEVMLESGAPSSSEPCSEPVNTEGQ